MREQGGVRREMRGGWCEENQAKERAFLPKTILRAIKEASRALSGISSYYVMARETNLESAVNLIRIIRYSYS